jgi:hypothetical protein
MFCIAKDNPQGFIDASVTSFFQKRTYYQRRKKMAVNVKFVFLSVPTNATSTIPSRVLSRSVSPIPRQSGSPIPRSGSPIPTHHTSGYAVSGGRFGRGWGGGSVRVGGDGAGDREGERGVSLRRLLVAKVQILESLLRVPVSRKYSRALIYDNMGPRVA